MSATSAPKPVTVATLRAMKQAGDKIVALTAYDVSFARVADRAGVDIVLVGDSLGMVMQGHDSTLPVTMDDMVYHSRCVARGLAHALLMVDMPFLSYQAHREQALANAGRLMQAGHAHMVKLEGGAVMADTVAFLTARGVPVCAHIGLTPQSVHQLGGYRVQGRDGAAAATLLADAQALQDAGASALLLEAVPATLAARITQTLTIPTIGIGAGVNCDGQVLVLQDLLGISAHRPRFAKNFMHGAADIASAVQAYAAAVRAGTFPAPEHSF